MSRSELFELSKEFMDFMNVKKGYTNFDEYDYSEDPAGISYEIQWGDWKHDHAFFKNCMFDFFSIEKQMNIEMESEVIEDDGSDCYSAVHFVYFEEVIND